MVSRTYPSTTRKPREFAAHFHLLGCVDFDDCLTLQRRLAYDAVSRADGRIVVLICEHPPLVTIGRAGSRRDVRLNGAELAERQLQVRYVGRGGGAILHGPGQLAIYVVAPLDWHGVSVGAHLRRLQAALQAALADFQIRPQLAPGSYSLTGRTGVLAALGVAVRSGVAMHGAFLNVNPPMRDYGRVATLAGRGMSSLLSERPVPVKMTAVRAALVAHLSAALECERHHIHTGHPHLAELPASDLCEPAA
jgi:lipoyl(octanoyl) transferase